MIKQYYYLTKPGIIRGNLMTAAAAFLLASGKNIDWWLLLASLAGIGLVIAAGCVFNNYIDRDIDRKMARTKKRAMVQGTISIKNAMLYATTLGISGLLLLAAYTNWLTVVLGLIGLFFYVVVYGIVKRKSVHGTLVGTISGATPTVAGYTAVTNSFDAGAIILFLILVTWQMPHFYAIAMYRLKDYERAGIPVLPAVKGTSITKVQIMVYIAGFIAAIYSLYGYGYAGLPYVVIMLGFGLVWLGMGLRGFDATDDEVWGRKMFLFSLLVLLSFSLTLSINAWLP